MIRRQTNLRVVERGAFTLMEMLVVVAIIVILAGGGAMAYLRFIDDAKRDSAKRGVKILETAVSAYYADPSFGQYPPDLETLARPPAPGMRAMIDPKALVDPWNQPYHYDPAQQHETTLTPRIWSDGPPGKQAPISNW